jgi:hypothetical protein
MKTYTPKIATLSRRFLVAASAAAILLLMPLRPEASIHELIGAMCNGQDEVAPYGQNKDGNSFLRALQATGFITSIDVTEDEVVLNFDPDIPASKFKSAGFDLVIEDGVAPGIDLVLSPLVVPDENFAAHIHCHELLDRIINSAKK